MRKLEIRFGSGRDVLNAYWGYLSDGGLMLPDHGLAPGELVALEVRVDSTQSQYALHGTVVRRDAGGQMIVRFSPGEPHDMLLTEALSETDNVPARRHRRYRVERPGRLQRAGDEGSCRVVDVSDEGVCVQLGEGGATAVVGDAVSVTWDGLSLSGRIVWSRHTERGIELDDPSRTGALREYVRTLSEGKRRGRETSELAR